MRASTKIAHFTPYGTNAYYSASMSWVPQRTVYQNFRAHASLVHLERLKCSFLDASAACRAVQMHQYTAVIARSVAKECFSLLLGTSWWKFGNRYVRATNTRMYYFKTFLQIICVYIFSTFIILRAKPWNMCNHLDAFHVWYVYLRKGSAGVGCGHILK